MRHLDPERLAELADLSDSEPNALERVHLAECASCAAERSAVRALLARAAHERDHERDHPAPPLTSWAAIAAGLRAEGLLAPETGVAGSIAPLPPAGYTTQSVTEVSGGRPVRGGGGARRWRGWMQAAAAVALVAGGMAAGRLSTGARALPGTGALASASSSDSSVRFVTAATDTMPKFGTLVEAQATLTRAEREYRQAMSFLAQNDTVTRPVRNSDLYRARLAALDAMAGAAREGVDELPHDPVINGYYMSTLAAREATLKQLGNTLPAGVRLTRF
ncbi:MAG: hypothetical protein WKG32_16495 [Gemmatimonadaceae bacterium]